MTMKNEPRGAAELGTLDDFLAEEGLLTEVTLRAAKRVIALQLQRAMDDQNITRAKMAQKMVTSRAQLARILDPDEFNVTLDSLERAAKVLGRQLKVELA